MSRRAVLLVAAMLLAACAGKPQPGDAVEAFYKSLVAADEGKLYDTVCPEWEAQAGLELDAFSGVSATLEGLTCEKSGTEGALTLVTCQGKIVLDYRGELRERSLDGITYLTKEVDGEWKMCGYR